MQHVLRVSLRQLQNQKYASVLCYPKYNAAETAKRTRQLKQLGVKAIDFTGDKRASDLPILGKGHVGVVVVAQTRANLAALKIRRVDADRKGMAHEAEMLRDANKLGIGPHLMGKTEDFMLMELIKGPLLPSWLTGLKGRGTRKKIRSVLHDILEQCYRLDQAGLDHGELSRAPKHIIIDEQNKPHIVDFESASTMRRTSNVTSICQYLFMKSQVAQILRRKLSKMDQEAVVVALRNYKHQPTRENFYQVLEAGKIRV